MSYYKCVITVFFALLLDQGMALAKTKDNIYIVQDTEYQSSPVKCLRDGVMIANTYKGNTHGLNELLISGSAQPNEKGWDEIIHFVSHHKNLKNNPIWVLDLRQESHGYLNGQAITLTNEYDWVNKDKNNQQIALDEEKWLNSLSIQKKITGILTKSQFVTKKYSSGKTIAVQTVQNEKQLVSQLGLNYHRLYITDHLAPKDSEVDSFLILLRNIPKGSWLHVHCRGGKGRTETFLVMYDMLKNANEVSFSDIITRHAAVAPYYNLFEVNRGNPFLTPYYEERIIFLKYFYQFAQDLLKGYKGTWSEWNIKNKSS